MGGMIGLKLEFNRTWSVPRDKVPDDAAIAAVLACPTYNDMMVVCWTFGIGRVRAILEEMQQTGDIGRFAAATSGRMVRVSVRRDETGVPAGLPTLGSRHRCVGGYSTVRRSTSAQRHGRMRGGRSHLEFPAIDISDDRRTIDQ